MRGPANAARYAITMIAMAANACATKTEVAGTELCKQLEAKVNELTASKNPGVFVECLGTPKASVDCMLNAGWATFDRCPHADWIDFDRAPFREVYCFSVTSPDKPAREYCDRPKIDCEDARQMELGEGGGKRVTECERPSELWEVTMACKESGSTSSSDTCVVWFSTESACRDAWPVINATRNNVNECRPARGSKRISARTLESIPIDAGVDGAPLADAKPEAPAPAPARRPPRRSRPTPVETQADTRATCLSEAECLSAAFPPACCDRFGTGRGISTRELTKLDISAGMGRIRGRIEQCSRLGVKGTVRVSVAVSAAGDVDKVTVKESPDFALGTCVAREIRSARFVETDRGGSFSYPFTFR